MSRAAVVTGAAGGIGRAICERLMKDGYYVIGIDRQECEAVDEWCCVDVGDMTELRAVTARLAERFSLSVVVHNAAVQPLAGAGYTDPVDFETTLRVNVLAADSLVHAARASLAAQRGSVVVVSSVHAVATTSGIIAYVTSKAALEGWVRAAAIDLGPQIRVNAVRPGAIDTAKLQEGFARWGDAAGTRRAVLEARTPLGRVGRPEEIAAAAAFLAGDEASFVTGATLVVDGGATCRLGSE